MHAHTVTCLYLNRLPLPGLFVAVALCAPVTAWCDWDELDIRGGATAVFQQELNSSDNDGSFSVDLMFDLPTANGGWFMYVEGSSSVSEDSIFTRYPSINGEAGSVLNRRGNSHLQISELNYRFDFGARSQLTIGEIDPSARIDRSRVSNDENTQFLNQSFINNPTIHFPDYTLGLMYRINAHEREPEFTVILASSDGIADNPTRSYSHLLDLTAAGKGVFASASARWFLDSREIGLGTWLRSDKHEYVDDTNMTDKDFGAYFVYGKAFGPQTINFRVGFANERVSQVARFVSITYGREYARGNLSLGYARAFESNRARGPDSDDSDQLEAWFRTPIVGNALHATASLQYVTNPGFDRTGLIAERNALVAGIRLDYSFQ